MISKRKVLINALEKDFLPFLMEKGFKQAPLKKEDKWYSPLGHFERKKGSDIEWVDIQFTKSGKAKFRLNLRVSKKGRFDPSLCALYSFQFSDLIMKWFSLPWLAWPLSIEARASKTVNRVVEVFPEVEEWFDSKKAGPHVRYFPATLTKEGEVIYSPQVKS